MSLKSSVLYLPKDRGNRYAQELLILVNCLPSLWFERVWDLLLRVCGRSGVGVDIPSLPQTGPEGGSIPSVLDPFPHVLLCPSPPHACKTYVCMHTMTWSIQALLHPMVPCAYQTHCQPTNFLLWKPKLSILTKEKKNTIFCFSGKIRFRVLKWDSN